VRSALGVAVLTFYGVLLLAGGQDIWAQRLNVALSSVTWTFRILVFTLPLVAGLFTWKLCRDLHRGRHTAREEAAAVPPIGPRERPSPVPRDQEAATERP
jgi:hypothetical protein